MSVAGGVYDAATAPARAGFRRWAARMRRFPLAIVFYHRVADEHPNPWTISRRDFRRHLDWLGERFECISLTELQRRARHGGSPRPAVAITFDDGYADNCEEALPELIRRRIPLTYFVTLGNVLSGRPFPHDVAAAQPLRPNTLRQLRELAAAGVEIGSHTRTHCDLGPLHDERRIRDEVVVATKELQQRVGTPVHYFAFPFGQPVNLHPMAARMAIQMGLDGVCTTTPAYVFPGGPCFELPRFHGDPNLRRLKRWLSYGPRIRLRKTRPLFAEKRINSPRELATPTGPLPEMQGCP